MPEKKQLISNMISALRANNSHRVAAISRDSFNIQHSQQIQYIRSSFSVFSLANHPKRSRPRICSLATRRRHSPDARVHPICWRVFSQCVACMRCNHTRLDATEANGWLLGHQEAQKHLLLAPETQCWPLFVLADSGCCCRAVWDLELPERRTFKSSRDAPFEEKN